MRTAEMECAGTVTVPEQEDILKEIGQHFSKETGV